MSQYVALTYTRDVDWSHPDQADEMKEYRAFGEAARAVIRAAVRCSTPRRPRSR